MNTSTNRQAANHEEEEYARLTLEEMGEVGDAVARLDGEVISVFGGIPGEEVVARIVRYKRRGVRHVSGIVSEVLKPSPHRAKPPCPYFGPCTGCQWQHIDYPHQLSLKREAVVDQLARYPETEGIPVSSTIPSPQLYGYRNHARFTVRAQGSLGFVNRITRRFVKIETCMLMAPWINETLGLLQGKCQETTQLSMRSGVNTGDGMIQPTLLSEEIPVPSGQTHYNERLGERTFRVASPSFFQTNTKLAEQMVDMVRTRLELNKDAVLVDAYAGVGTFAVLLAPHVRRVIAIEESLSAVRDASVNAAGIENLEFVQGKTEHVLDGLEERVDAVILDPPRSGCHPDALAGLIRLAPGRVVYVSCEPETLARDLSALVRGGYRVETVEPLDMFPQTYHVECVASLKLIT